MDNLIVPKGFSLDRNGKLWLSANQFYADAWEAAEDLRKIYTTKDPTYIYCIARGGYPFGAVVGNCFNVNDIPVLMVSSYTGEKQGNIRFKELPTQLLENQGDGSLILDDLFDTGNTVRKLKQLLPKAFFAAVYAKPAGKAVASYCFKDIPDTWVVFPWEQSPKDFVPA